MQAASIFLQSAAIDTHIGMISFHSTTQGRIHTYSYFLEIYGFKMVNLMNPNSVRSNLVQIQDDDTRATLIQRLPDITELGVGTGLGGAVQSAMHILHNTGPAALRDTGGEILLLTDGIETVKAWLLRR